MIEFLSALVSIGNGIGNLIKRCSSPFAWWRKKRRCVAYGRRMFDLREQYSSINSYIFSADAISAENFSDLMGFEDLDIVAKIEAGKVTPHPDQLTRVVAGTGACRRYLLDGSSKLWEDTVIDVFEPLGALEYIDSSVLRVTAVRVDQYDGGVLLILEKENWHDAKVITMHSFSFGSGVGGTGRAHQYEFFILRCLLKDFLIPERAKELVSSYFYKDMQRTSHVQLFGKVADQEVFLKLVDGVLHPVAFLARSRMNDNWFMDSADLYGASVCADNYEAEFGKNFCDFQKNVRERVNQELGIEEL